MADMPIVVVVTGGPCAGKTTVLEAARKTYGDLIYIIPESATMVLSAPEFPAPDKSFNLVEWNTRFQKILWEHQILMFSEGLSQATRQGARVVLCDRGLLDGAAYFGGLAEFARLMNADVDSILAQYGYVVHLESLATAEPTLFGKQGNAARYEDVATAQARERSLREVYRRHPHWQFMSGKGGIDAVVDRFLKFLDNLVSQEIERKWLLAGKPDIDLGDGSDFRQCYLLAQPDIEVGYRHDGKVAKERIKEQVGASRRQRREVEHILPDSTFERLWNSPEVHRLIKTRYKIPDRANGVVEIDHYPGPAGGYWVAEREFDRPDLADSYQVPPWLVDAGAIEVTEDARFSNRSIAVNGFPSGF